MREQKFAPSRKVGMINLWRKRCEDQKKARPVNPADCALCDAIAKEICGDIMECVERHAFGVVKEKAEEVANKN